MEILQTIWTALTTENELLTKFVVIPQTFLETLVNMLLFTSLLNLNANSKIKLKYIFTVSILGNIFNFILPNPFKSYINLIMILLKVL